MSGSSGRPAAGSGRSADRATAPVTVLNNPTICHEMVGSSVCDGGSDHVAGPHLRVTDRDVDQATISGSARHASGDPVLPSLADAYEDFDVRAHHRPVTGQRGFFDDGDQAVVAVLHHVLVDLMGQIGGRRAGPGENLNVKALANRAARTTPSVSSKSASVSPGNPTMMSVVIAAAGIAARTRAMMSR